MAEVIRVFCDSRGVGFFSIGGLIEHRPGVAAQLPELPFPALSFDGTIEIAKGFLWLFISQSLHRFSLCLVGRLVCKEARHLFLEYNSIGNSTIGVSLHFLSIGDNTGL